MTAASTASGFAFGPFRLLKAQRILLRGDRPVRLGGRAFDLLSVLVERAGELVSRQDLARGVWPDTVVADGTLTVHLAALRRALDDGRDDAGHIVNRLGLGYVFVAPVTALDSDGAVADSGSETVPAHNLPFRMTRLIGRDALIADLRGRLAERRLITLVGPGGIGKTALALAVAEAEVETASAPADGVWLVDMAAVAEPSLAPGALASTLRLVAPVDDALLGLVNTLRDKAMLLVLDNCEHVIEAVADMTAAILADAPGVRVLATSREPLRIDGEHAHRLSPLESPPDAPGLTAAQALTFPAVRLLVERAAAVAADFVLTDADAPSAARIGRDLDGLPLAIELAAAGVETFGLHGLATRLEARLELSETHRAAAPARHRTLGAALDWSYQLLSPAARTLLRRLAVFRGGFTLESAAAVAAEAAKDTGRVADLLMDLALKSLVAVHFSDGEPRFRLLETTRAFALRKLAEQNEVAAVSRRHAAYYRDLVDGVAKAQGGAFRAVVGAEIDNVRAALAWAFAPGGDENLAVALAAGTAPILLHMYLLPECHQWMGKAVDALGEADRGTRREMVLQCALGLALMYTQSTSDRARQALTRARDLAEGFREPGWELQALLALTAIALRQEAFDDALSLAERAMTAATHTGDGLALGRAQAVRSSALLMSGRYREAILAGEAAHQAIDAVRRTHPLREGGIHAIYAQVTVAVGLWAEGRLDQSGETTRRMIDEAEAGGDPAALCLALTWCGAPLTLALGDLALAQSAIARLRTQAERSGLRAYLACAVALEGRLAVARGDLAGGEAGLRAGLDRLVQSSNAMFATPYRIDLADLLVEQGRAEDALAVVADAVADAEARGGWCAPELLRVMGEIRLRTGDVALAEQTLNRAVETARRQEALYWELRATISLARLRHARGDSRAAHDLLDAVHGRFTEGLDAPELRRARALLATWRGA